MRPTTRRTVTKLLLAAPAALAGGTLACQSLGSSGSADERLSPEQRRQREAVSKSVSRLKQSVERIEKMDIRVGSEPAITFEPYLAKK
jgi:hypothetical protein